MVRPWSGLLRRPSVLRAPSLSLAGFPLQSAKAPPRPLSAAFLSSLPAKTSSKGAERDRGSGQAGDDEGKGRPFRRLTESFKKHFDKMNEPPPDFPYDRAPNLKERIFGGIDMPSEDELHDPGPPTLERSEWVLPESSLKVVEPSELDMAGAAPVLAPPAVPSHCYPVVPGPGGAPMASFRLYRLAIDYANQTPMTQYDTLHIDEQRVYMAHMTAVQQRRLSYQDPKTGATVLTVAQLIANGACCGNGCRHCPYHLANVPEDLRQTKLWNGAFWV